MKSKVCLPTIRQRSHGGVRLTVFMALVSLSLLIAMNFAHSETSEEISDDGWEMEVSEESEHGHAHGEADQGNDAHGHAHGGGDEKTAQVTVWGDRFEIFLEHPYIVAGDPTPFVTHVTDLQELVPRTEGQIEFVFRLGSELPMGQVAKAPVRDGIYIPELTFPKAGTWDVSILIPVDGKDSIVELPPTEVFATSEDIDNAPDPEEIEGITFLKEQQWKFPFEKAEYSSNDPNFFAPEQAIAKGDAGPIVFVHPAGETVQPRVVEIGEPKEGKVEILSGLQNGDRVVVRGTDAILVSAESESDEGHAHGAHEEDDHGHEHGASEEAEEDHGHEHGDAGHPHEEADHPAEESVHLSEEMRDSLDLTTAVVDKGDLVRTLDVYGWVRPRQESMTEVRAPLTGIVKEILARPGKTLKKGDPLVSLQSREILEWQQTILNEGNRRKKFEDTKILLKAEGRAKMVELLGGLRVDAAELNRISSELDLIEKAGTGSVAQREINRIKGQFESAKASLQAKETLAEAYGLSPDLISNLKSGASDIQTQEGDLPPNFRRQLREIEFNLQSSVTEEKIAVTNLRSLGFEEDRLKSLIKGDPEAVVNTITLRAENPFLVTELLMKRQSSLNLGDPILAGIDYSDVLIDAEIPEVEIDDVLARASDKIPVQFPALEDQTFEAEVLFFDTKVHAGDRKAHLVLKLRNTQNLTLRDGMAASVGIPVEIRHDALTVPKESVLSDGLERIVFVAKDDVYIRQPVQTGVNGFGSTEILEGLDSGQRVVVIGAPSLLLSLKSQEGSLEVGHGHAH